MFGATSINKTTMEFQFTLNINKHEAEVQAAIESIIENGLCTTISIAHRLSTVKNCDQIFVLKRLTDFSEIVESGSHNELMALNGVSLTCTLLNY